MEQDSGPPIPAEGDTGAMEAIRNGKNLRKPECGDFWEDFMSLCNNASALADLLNVPAEKIQTWATRIQENLEKIKKMDSGESENKEMMRTGDATP